MSSRDFIFLIMLHTEFIIKMYEICTTKNVLKSAHFLKQKNCKLFDTTIPILNTFWHDRLAIRKTIPCDVLYSRLLLCVIPPMWLIIIRDEIDMVTLIPENGRNVFEKYIFLNPERRLLYKNLV